VGTTVTSPDLTGGPYTIASINAPTQLTLSTGGGVTADANAALTFPNFGGASTFTFSAWDETSGLSTPYGADGGTASVLSATVATAGSGYNVGDILNLTPATFTTPIQLQVTSIGAGGSITGVTVLQTGSG